MDMKKHQSSSGAQYLILSLGLSIVLAVVLGYFTYQTQQTVNSVDNIKEGFQLTYWIRDSPNTTDDYRSINKVFSQLGYRLVDGSKEPWDVMWAKDLPFHDFSDRTVYMPHQRINHLPGVNFLTNKLFLGLSTQSKYIPVTYEFPRLKNEFLYYHKHNSDSKFIVKNSGSGGVKLINLKKTDFHLGDTK